MARMVHCVKLNRELEGLDIYNEISKDAWQMWMTQSVILINHYGLSLGDPKAHDFLMLQMEDFFFGPDAPMPEGWTPEGVPGSGTPQQTKGSPF